MGIGKNIKKLRLEKNLTQKQLSELTGISEVMISQYERDIRTPKNKNLYKLAYILDKTGGRLLDEDLPFDLVPENSKILTDINDLNNNNGTFYTILDTPISTNTQLPLDLFEHKLINNYRLLNTKGKKEANKRIEELTEINKYTEPENSE